MRRRCGEEQSLGNILPHMQGFIWNGDTGTIVRTPAFSADIRQERHMPDSKDQNGSTRGRTLAVIAAFVFALLILAWGSWNTRHVDSNPGPSGTPGSTAVEGTPPPAAGPSETTAGTAR
jgi:hypothetical protein